MHTRTLLTVAGTISLSATVLAGPPRLLPRQVPLLQVQCGASGTVNGVATALGADGSVAGEAGCGSTTYGSHGFIVSPRGVVSELDGGTFTFSGPEFVIGDGATVGTGDWCPPVNGACVSALTRSQVGSPIQVIAASAASAPVITSGNMSGWVCGWGGISATNAWRLRPEGTFEPLDLQGAWGIYAEQVSSDGFVAGHAYVGNQKRAIRWDPNSTAATLLPSLVAGTPASATGAGDSGMVVGQSGGRAAAWDASGSPVALLPAGSASEATHIVSDDAHAGAAATVVFGTHAAGTRLFRATTAGDWADLGPPPAAGQSFLSVHVVAAPRRDFMVAVAHTQLYEQKNFLWTAGGGIAALESFLVDMPASIGALTVVDANAAGQLLVNANAQHKAFLLQLLAEGDTNGDGAVDGADIGQVLGAWGAVPAGTRSACDFDGNGAVDGADLGIVLGNWSV